MAKTEVAFPFALAKISPRAARVARDAACPAYWRETRRRARRGVAALRRFVLASRRMRGAR